MALYRIDGSDIKEYEKKPAEKEASIEKLIEKYPQILEKDMFIIGRQVRTGDANLIDILGINKSGDAIIVELKKGKTPRDVIGQILEYTEWVNTIGSDELNRIIKKEHIGDHASIWDKFKSMFGHIPDLNEHQKLYIVAEKIDPIIEKISRYLRKSGLKIFCVELNLYQNNNQMFCATKMVVGEEKPDLSNIIPDENSTHDWDYYSKIMEVDDKVVSRLKNLAKEIIEFGKNNGVELSLNFNRGYYAIKHKNLTRNIVYFSPKKSKIWIYLPVLKDRNEIPDQEIAWEWDKNNGYWRKDFSHDQLPGMDDLRKALKRSIRR